MPRRKSVLPYFLAGVSGGIVIAICHRGTLGYKTYPSSVFGFWMLIGGLVVASQERIFRMDELRYATATSVEITPSEIRPA
jgi:hypothetical protein